MIINHSKWKWQIVGWLFRNNKKYSVNNIDDHDDDDGKECDARERF